VGNKKGENKSMVLYKTSVVFIWSSLSKFKLDLRIYKYFIFL